MAWIILAAGLVIIAAAEWAAPREYTAHASRQKPFLGWRPMGHRANIFNRMVGHDRHTLPISEGTVVVRVDGTSWEDFGLADGSRAVGERVGPDAAGSLANGTLVVVNGPADFESGLRIRRFKEVSGDQMHFYPDGKGPVTPRPVSELWAVLTHRQVKEEADA